MTNQSGITSIEINATQRRFTVLLNVLKMLSARGLIDKEQVNNKFEKMKNNFSDELMYKIETDDKNIIYLKFIPQKITTINKILGISDFLSTFKDNHKIIIVSDINKKAYKQIIEFPLTEIFWHFEFMMNLIDHKYIPEHTILPLGFQPSNFDTEGKYKDHEKFEDTYLVTKRECPKIETTDPVARYYNMVPGQYIRINRMSINSGYSPSYRIVVSAPIAHLFERFQQ